MREQVGTIGSPGLDERDIVPASFAGGKSGGHGDEPVVGKGAAVSEGDRGGCRDLR